VTPFTTLEPSEKNLLLKTRQEDLWDELLERMDPPLMEAFVENSGMLAPYDTKRIVYMDIENRRLKIMKVLHDHSRTAYVLDQPVSVELEQALAWNSGQSGFYYEHMDEEENRILFTIKLSEAVERQEKEEADEQRKREEEAAAARRDGKRRAKKERGCDSIRFLFSI
jgi:hypothetical protein